MFTGLVECTGTVIGFEETKGGRRFTIRAPEMDLTRGESLAVNGCCLTASTFEGEQITFDLLNETLLRTNLGTLKPGSRVNLERALAADARLGGHFVQGHVDGTAPVLRIESAGPDLGLYFSLPESAEQYFVSKGSIAVNGVSLTIAALDSNTFGVWIIPHTRELTNLGNLRVGDFVNLEFDMLAKYIERLVSLRGR